MKKKWNVIFLVYAELGTISCQNDVITKSKDNITPNINHNRNALTIETDLQYLFDDIINAGNLPEVGVFVIYNSVDVENKLDCTALYQLKKNDTNFEYELKRIGKPSGVNIRKPEIIITLFKQIESINSSDHRLLFTWDHGSIFGIFKRDQNFINDLGLKYQIVKTNDSHQLNNMQRWVLKGNQPYDRSWDEVNKDRVPFIAKACDDILRVPTNQLVHDILTNEELASAISKGFDNGMVDILVMMNCCMLNINTEYAIYKFKAAQYLIAPQSEINFPAYNYLEIFKELRLNPDLSPFSLSKYIIQTIPISRSKRDQEFVKNSFCWAILCLDIKQMEEIINILKLLIIELRSLLNNDREKICYIQKARYKCYTFDSYSTGLSNYMIDLGTFLFLIRHATAQLYNLYCMFMTHFNNLVIDSFVGHKIYEPRFTNYVIKDNPQPSGISIFFPIDKNYLDVEIFHSFIAENSISRSEFFSDLDWLTFICDFMRLDCLVSEGQNLRN